MSVVSTNSQSLVAKTLTNTSSETKSLSSQNRRKVSVHTTGRLLRLDETEQRSTKIWDDVQEAMVDRSDEVLYRVVHSQLFGFLIAIIIVVNAIQIGFETDHKGEFDWSVFEVVFLLIYVMELLLRFGVDRMNCFRDPWFLFDFTVVSVSCVQMIVDSLGEEALGSGGSVVVLRIARLVKVARIVRILRFCSELYLLVTSMVGAMKTVFWMWVLLALVIYMFSILFCNEVGHSYPEDEEIQDWFGTVIRTCFTLFRILTLDSWTQIAGRMWNIFPAMVLLIIVFISLTTFAIVNVVVAIIVQHVIDEALGREEEAAKKLEKELMQKTTVLAKMFIHSDEDGDGSLTKDEFVKALEDKGIQRTLRAMDLDFSELQMIFDLIDFDGDGNLTVNEFVQGVLQMRGTARSRRLFELHCEFSRYASWTENRFDTIENGLMEQLEILNNQQEVLNNQQEVLNNYIIHSQQQFKAIDEKLEMVLERVGNTQQPHMINKNSL